MEKLMSRFVEWMTESTWDNTMTRHPFIFGTGCVVIGSMMFIVVILHAVYPLMFYDLAGISKFSYWHAVLYFLFLFFITLWSLVFTRIGLTLLKLL